MLRFCFANVANDYVDGVRVLGGSLANVANDYSMWIESVAIAIARTILLPALPTFPTLRERMRVHVRGAASATHYASANGYEFTYVIYASSSTITTHT